MGIKLLALLPVVPCVPPTAAAGSTSEDDRLVHDGVVAVTTLLI